MLKPDELESDHPYGPSSSRASDVWDAIRAAAAGDAATLRRLLELDPNLHRAQFWYNRPVYFAVREGRLEALRVLLDAGAEPPGIGPDGEDLVAFARERGHEAVARLLENALASRGLAAPGPADHPIHVAAAAGDAARVGELLDADPRLVHRRDRAGGTPLHRAVAGSAREVVGLLLDRGADLHALHGEGPGSESGYAAAGFQPIDLALWDGRSYGVRGDLETARILLARGASFDLVIASALGEIERVRSALDQDPGRIAEARPSGKRALSTALQFGHEPIVRMLLDRGADPNGPEGAIAPRGMALHVAAGTGDRPLVELLLSHGADPNGWIDSSGSATFAARTAELRSLLIARGGTLDPYDLVWLGEDDEVVRRVSADPRSANAGCGGVLAAACRQGKRDLLVRLLGAGARVPPVLTPCRSYLLEDPEMLRLLLQSGMDPNLPNWQMATPLHDLCGRDRRGRPRARRTECATILLDAGASLTARDEDYRSTPLAWAARTDLPDMVELLLARGAPTRLPDDEPWATPLAWAARRGHGRIAEMLRERSDRVSITTQAPAAAAPGSRIASIDLIRGAVMILMAIDHVRVYSGLPAGGPSPGIFFTRWITHFCAPAFIFLAGTSAFLHRRTHGDPSRFLLTRGLWLVLLELTFLRVAWTFNLDFAHYALAGVIWVIGWSMVVLAGLARLPLAVVGVLGIAIIAGHHVIAPPIEPLNAGLIEGASAAMWKILYVGFFAGPIRLGTEGPDLIVLYSLIPWVGVMAAGYGFGKVLTLEPARRNRICLAIGLGAIALFVVLRGLNLYGDPRPWSAATTGTDGRPPMPAVLSFLNATKYPASLAFLLMTLGPTLALMPLLEGARGALARWISVFGRVPFFYYMLHIPLIHALALVVSKLRLGTVSPWLFANHPMGNPPAPEGYAWSLSLLYMVWVVAIVLLYPVCRWFADLKARRRDWWLSYL